MSLVTNSQEPYFAEHFPTYDDIVRNVASFLNVKDACNVELVCKAWAEAFSKGSNVIWEKLIKRDFFDGVENQTSGLKQVYRTLHFYPGEVICRKVINKWFGDVRNAPPLRIDYYEELVIGCTRDSFDPQKQFVEENPLILDVSHVYRPNDETLYSGETLRDILTTERAKEEDKPTITENNELKIPMTLRNIIRLVQILYSDRNIFGPIEAEVLKQCNKTAEKTELYFMRKNLVLRGTTPDCQKTELEKRKMVECPFRLRALYDLIQILEKNDCPDNRGDNDDWILARTANAVRKDDKDCFAVIGGYAPVHPIGIGILARSNKEGVVPAIDAGVKRS